MGNLGPMLNTFVGVCVLVIALGLAVPFLAIYLVEERRGREVGDVDPQLGIKTILAMLFSLGLQVATVGAAVFVASQFADGGFAGYRMGLGLMLGGLITATLPYVGYFGIAGKSNQKNLFRTALGINGTVYGIGFVLSGTSATMSALTTGLSVASISFALVYLVGALLCLGAFARSSGKATVTQGDAKPDEG